MGDAHLIGPIITRESRKNSNQDWIVPLVPASDDVVVSQVVASRVDQRDGGADTQGAADHQ
jgi:hypothetical protein